MSALTFPLNPFNGQLYPTSPLPGEIQYQYDAAINMWRLLGAASGVIPGIYGSATKIPVFEVSATGVILNITETLVQSATTSQPGLVQLVNDTVTADSSKALTAAMGKFLQDQIDAGVGSVSQVSTGPGLTGGPITSTGTISLLPPTGGNIGGVKAGTNIAITADGTISAVGVGTGTVSQVSTGLGLNGGPITSIGTIALSPATSSTIGGVKPDGVTTFVTANGTLFTTNDGTVTSVDVVGGYGISTSGGPVTSSGEIVVSLTDTTVSVGTYTNATVSVDSKGRVTYAASGPAIDLQDVTDNGPSTTNQITVAGIIVGDDFNGGPSVAFSGSTNSGLRFNALAGEVEIVEGGLSVLGVRDTEILPKVNVNLATGAGLSINGPLSVQQALGALRFYDADNSNYVGFRGPNTVSSDLLWQLPANDGTSGQVLTTNGSGSLSWSGGPIGTLQQVTDRGAATTNTITVQSSLSPATENVKVYSNLVNILNGRLQVQTGGLPGVYIDGVGTPRVTVYGGGYLSLGTGTNLYSQTIKLDGATGEATVSDLLVSGDGTLNGKVRIADQGNYSDITFYTTLGTVGATIQGVQNNLYLTGANFASINSHSIFYPNGNVVLNNGASGSTEIQGSLVTGGQVGINGPTGGATLTVNGTIYSDTATTIGDFQVVRAGSTAALVSGEAGSSFVPSLRIAGLEYPTTDGTLGEFLTTDGSGTLSWAPISSATSTLQQVTDAGATTTNSITVGGLTAANLTYPTTDGTAGQFMTTDGAGTLSWGTGGGGSVGTLQDVTNNGATTTNAMTVTNGTLTTSISTGGISSTDAGLLANLNPGRLQLYGNQGVELYSSTSSPTLTLNLESSTGKATVASLVAAGLTYPTTDGSPGEVLTTDGAGTLSWGSVALPSRTVVSGTTALVNDLDLVTLDIQGFKSYLLMKIECDDSAWVRVYTDPDARIADLTRNIGNDPNPGSGVIAEGNIVAPSTTSIMSPFTAGGNLETPETDTIYLTVQNLSGVPRAFNVSLTILQLEI